PYAAYSDARPAPPPSSPVGLINPNSRLANQLAGPDRRLIHTFGRRNNPGLSNRRNWLVHLDRQVISPAELLHVSAYPPHLLTQKLVSPAATGESAQYNHLVPWFDQGNRLYRFLEFVDAGHRAAGVAPHGRAAGKINLNTIYDPETFRA